MRKLAEPSLPRPEVFPGISEPALMGTAGSVGPADPAVVPVTGVSGLLLSETSGQLNLIDF